ncbi:dolichol-phosphate mannose synthase subunit 3 isoform X1 [Pistacia vera]|nr:dolichol-phosphate mannose synthase subunit 3 isoform X1 [Pistacia vera]
MILRIAEQFIIANSMKHVVKILTLVVAITAFWIGLLQTSVVPCSHTWLLPIYFIVSLGCYGLLMVGIGLICFPTCPQEALLLQQDIKEAKEYLKRNKIDVGSD